MRANQLDELDQLVGSSVAPHVATLQALQDPETGGVLDPEAAERALDALARGVEEVGVAVKVPDAGAAFRSDVARWRFDGLECTPNFDRSMDALSEPANLEPFFLVAPVDGNGVAARLEYVLGLRHEPEEVNDVAQSVPRGVPTRVNLRLIDASDGIGDQELAAADVSTTTRRNNLVLGFPHRVASMLANHVVPNAIEASGRSDWAVATLVPAELYRAVCVHDHLHHAYRHTRWYPRDDGWIVDYAGSVLDTVRVDAEVAVQAAEIGVPYADAILDIVCFNRLFPRYRDSRSAPIRRFLFAWLTRHGGGALRFRSGYLELDSLAAVDAFGELIDLMGELDALDPHDRRIEARLIMARYAGDSTRSGPTVGSGASF